MQVFQRNVPAQQNDMLYNEWVDDCIQSALYSGSSPTPAQRVHARMMVLRRARQQVQLPVDEAEASVETAHSPNRVLAAVIVFQRHVRGFFRSCFVNDAPYNRANSTGAWGRHRKSNCELAYLEFAPMAY